MPLFAEIRDGDCPEFIEALECFIHRLINAYDLPQLFIVRVDNWFDHKWLGFSGKTFDLYDIKFPDITFSPPVWKEGNDVTFPPFSPNRIIEQQHFNVCKDRIRSAKPLRNVYSLKKQPSGLNLHNRVLNFCDKGLFIWFSSKSGLNGRASLMVYHTWINKTGCWYASLLKRDRWMVDQAKNIDRQKISKIFSLCYDNEK